MNQAPITDKFCNGCGEKYDGPQVCPACGCPEYGLHPHGTGANYVCLLVRRNGAAYATLYKIRRLRNGQEKLLPGVELCRYAKIEDADSFVRDYNLRLKRCRRNIRKRLAHWRAIKPAPAFKEYALRKREEAAKLAERVEAGEIVEEAGNAPVSRG